LRHVLCSAFFLLSETIGWMSMRTGFITKILFAQIMLTLCVGEALAKPCVVPPLSEAAISQFKANPKALVAPGSDTRTIEATVRDLAGTDATLASDLVRLAQDTNPRFQTAIAAGLAQAAVACQTIDQQAALLIQQAVASFADGEFQSAFAAVAGDLSTAAVAAAGAAATGSVGSVVVTNPNSGGAAPTNFGGGGALSFFVISGSVAAFPPTATATGTTFAPTPVSPSR
jgi:hypothetical protein